MAKASTVQSSFIGGVISQKLWNRIQHDFYADGVAELKNMVLIPQGGAYRRTGTIHTVEVKDSTKKVRLIPFVFKTEQAYILEFGDQYMRVVKDYGQVLDTDNSVYELVTPYLEAELKDIKFVQSNDIMFLVHPNHKPQKLSRTGHANWSINDYTPANDPFTAADGYPSAIAIFMERLVFAGSNNDLNRLWFSEANDWETFTVDDPETPKDTDSFEVTIASGQVNAIRWMEPFEDILFIGCNDSEHKVYSTADTGLALKNFKRELVSNNGCSSVQGRVMGSGILYMESGGERVRTMEFNIDTQTHKTPDMTLLADTIAEGGITAMAFQNKPHRIMWAVRADGKLLGFTYMRDQNITGWHIHEIGGTDTVVEDVAVIPSSDEIHNDVYLVVKRTINGITKRYIEYFSHEEYETQVDWHYNDGGYIYDGAATSTISGLDWLEGETVQVLTDGTVQAPRAVTGGSITLDYAASKVHIGLQYQSVLETLPIEAGSASGNPIGKIKQIDGALVNFYESLGGKVGQKGQPLETLYSTMPPTPHSGNKYVSFMTASASIVQIQVTQDEPLPLNINAVSMFITLNEAFQDGTTSSTI